MDGSLQSLRSRALQRIAELSATPIPGRNRHTGFNKLYGALPNTQDGSKALSNGDLGRKSLAGTPMVIEELHVLLALCKAAPQVGRLDDAERLLQQLSPYLLEAHEQVIAPSPFLQSVEPSPWEALSQNLTSAILIIGLHHPSLRQTVYNTIIKYITNCVQLARSEAAVWARQNGNSDNTKNQKPQDIVMLSMSILGFLEAASKLFHFFASEERLEIVRALQTLLSENFVIAVEGALSSIRNSDASHEVTRDQQILAKRYAGSGRPLGAMLLQQGLMRLLVSCGSLQIATREALQRHSVLEHLMPMMHPEITPRHEDNLDLVEVLSDAAVDSMRLLDDGADYLQLGSAWQQHLAFKVRGHALTTFLTCVLVDEEIADADILLSWLENAMADPIQMADDDLASIVLKCLAILAKTSPVIAASQSRALPRFIVQGGIQGQIVDVAARCYATILRVLSQDAVITGLYTLGNVLSASSTDKGLISSIATDGTWGSKSSARYTQHSTGSAISVNFDGEEETSAVYGNIIRAIVTVAVSSEDRNVIPLAQSMLLQKLGRISASVDSLIIIESAALGAAGHETELKPLLRLYDRLGHDAIINKKPLLLDAIRKAHNKLSSNLAKDSTSFQLYILHLLESIVSKGDVRESHGSHKADVELTAEEIAQLLGPLATVAPFIEEYCSIISDESTAPLRREVWFNIAVHGIIPGSPLWEKHLPELKDLVVHTKPLIAEDRTDHLESDIELNTVLRRGMGGQHTTEMKKQLIKLLPKQESHIRSIAYPKVIFLLAAYSVETLRADSGVCADVLSYFIDPSVNQEGISNCMTAVADEVLARFLTRSHNGLQADSTAPYVAKELAKVLTVCCHRISQCQQVATGFADKLIAQVPSSLCHRSSLFALLELLTLLWSSCLEAEIDEYEWKSSYTSTLGNVRLELSDDYEYRRHTLRDFHRRAKGWVIRIINVAPLDVKGLLQTYLSEYDDDGAYGHVSLGRSFAIEMGSVIPKSDQRLGAIDRSDEHSINTASDFVAQYTTRQEYRYANVLPEYDQDWMSLLHLKSKHDLSSGQGGSEEQDAQAILAVLDHRVTDGKYISIGELRDLLRRAAALVCRSRKDQSAIIQHLVSIPFSLFSKQSLKLGISLWLGVINENPAMESRILTEIAKNWEESVQKKQGIFNDKHPHLDPFYLKEEYAPSDRTLLFKRQQVASNLIAPHLRVLQFLYSHFNAYRLGSPHLRRSYQRVVKVTLEGLKHSSSHPLAREFHLQVILFGLTILRYSDDLSYAVRWRLKDKILSAGLAWFSLASRWSFGGNRLQVKAECQLMLDVEGALNQVTSIGSQESNTLQALSTRQELFLRLLEHEHSRLQVWLYPATQEPKHRFSTHRGGRTPLASISAAILKVAWTESPGLAIQVAIRANSPPLLKEVRWQLLNHSCQALEEPDALPILLENGLSLDASSQLKYLLYWRPINPISAVTYFSPAYQYHPFVLQYAMRALESHSVEVTFFYVPQIVQTLRYDALGYVQRYIVETAKVSQLFAHQIIWNMKANAYKDEDSTIEDSIKPTLDVVMANMIACFSGVDKAFYEKEFEFFNEVTDISGKLRPYIKREKAEKKQKIEEELRKIKVEVGVYLPSNPEGVVIGIDRKSGKPLQSHAKAPYMATFRIRKNKGEMEGTEEMLESTNQTAQSGGRNTSGLETTYDVWQSAIFKVGDDCRQDVLALQLIAAFRNIFNDVGLDVWVYPYRVTATAPGCGVIDVLPNSISRDMLGREAVNGLYDYFVSKYGGENSVRFQEARNNFVKSMAAYSVISYLLQFKDRHNGNIMIDDAGHIIHIDFGFCFDIAPGGVKFERAPFKLTSEMVAVMGGSANSQSYKWFEELCIKAFLAARPYTEKLSHMVVTMLDSGLPCFKPETIAHFKERMVLEKTEREAADFMKDLVKKSHNNYSTKVYDEFQLLTNGIPY